MLVFFALVFLHGVVLAGIGDAPDRAAGIVGNEQRAVARHRKRRRPSQTSARRSPEIQKPVAKFS